VVQHDRPERLPFDDRLIDEPTWVDALYWFVVQMILAIAAWVGLVLLDMVLR
jgi:hypothetical protein